MWHCQPIPLIITAVRILDQRIVRSRVNSGRAPHAAMPSSRGRAHVFIVYSDMRKLACDAFGIPCCELILKKTNRACPVPLNNHRVPFLICCRAGRCIPARLCCRLVEGAAHTQSSDSVRRERRRETDAQHRPRGLGRLRRPHAVPHQAAAPNGKPSSNFVSVATCGTRLRALAGAYYSMCCDDVVWVQSQARHARTRVRGGGRRGFEGKGSEAKVRESAASCGACPLTPMGVCVCVSMARARCGPHKRLGASCD